MHLSLYVSIPTRNRVIVCVAAVMLGRNPPPQIECKQLEQTNIPSKAIGSKNIVVAEGHHHDEHLLALNH